MNPPSSATPCSPLDSAAGTRLRSIVARRLLIVVLVRVIVTTDSIFIVMASSTDVRQEMICANVVHPFASGGTGVVAILPAAAVGCRTPSPSGTIVHRLRLHIHSPQANKRDDGNAIKDHPVEVAGGGGSDCLCHHLYLLTFSCAESVSSPIQSAFAPP